ncbi:hypothetical protein, partial [uncultured Chryseobacterium sp.]|uniref:hypothetical protein n=1 Tax=uncultured Chryseobacterium sp. TaxID=259322 RepID=UPI0025EC5F89
NQVEGLEDGSWVPDVPVVKKSASGVDDQTNRFKPGAESRLKGWKMEAGCRRFLLSKNQLQVLMIKQIVSNPEQKSD